MRRQIAAHRHRQNRLNCTGFKKHNTILLIMHPDHQTGMLVSIPNALLQSFTANKLAPSRQCSQVPSSYSITVAQPPCELTAPSHVAVTSTVLYPLGFYFVFLISRHPPPLFFHHGPTIGTKETKTGKWSGHNQQRLKHAHKFPEAMVKNPRNWRQTGGR